MRVAPYIRLLQFIVSPSTTALPGKKENIKTRVRYSTAKMLVGAPNLPRLHRAVGSFSPRYLLMMTQAMEIMYEDMRAAVPRDAMALNATVEPMLMRDRRMVTQ